MPRITIEISTDDSNFLIHRTRDKWYFEKAWNIFANAKIIELKMLEWEKSLKI